MQVKVEAAIANGHQIDAPRRFRLSIHADTNGKGFTPTLSDMRRAFSADQHIGIDVVKLNQRAKSQATHGKARPGYLGRNSTRPPRPPITLLDLPYEIANRRFAGGRLVVEELNADHEALGLIVARRGQRAHDPAAE